MTQIQTDILVAGGGIAGMIASLTFAREGFRVTCVERSAPPSPDGPQDLRSTAFLMPSIRLLKESGIFQGLEEIAERLNTMRIVDAGTDLSPRQSVDFIAQEVNEEQFGWNIPNAPLRERLSRQIEDNPLIEMIYNDAVTRCVTRTTGVKLLLESGRSVAAHLIVAADGRNSTLRQAAGIDVTTYRYGQKALVFQVSHALPHAGVSTEVHHKGGPFTLVPLAGYNQTRSAIVWMTDGPEADRLHKLDATAFEEALNYRSAGVMGRLSLETERGVWPIISQFASRLTVQRLALVGETAHVVPPIGAQGLNMSLADIACLRDLISDVSERDQIGADSVLDAFQRKRWLDMRARVQGIDALNRASISGSQPLRDLRASLLGFLGQTAPIKRTLMRTGIGA